MVTPFGLGKRLHISQNLQEWVKHKFISGGGTKLAKDQNVKSCKKFQKSKQTHLNLFFMINQNRERETFQYLQLMNLEGIAAGTGNKKVTTRISSLMKIFANY
jgi:hypothetical protein